MQSNNNDLPKQGYSNTLPEIQPVNIYDGAESMRILPRQLSTGTSRGTQYAGYGGAAIDGANNRLVMAGNDGTSVGIGVIPNSDITAAEEVGLFAQDADGTLIFKLTNGTLFMFNKDTGENTLQLGVLPDGTTNLAIAKDTYEVEDAF